MGFRVGWRLVVFFKFFGFYKGYRDFYLILGGKNFSF